MKKTKHNIEISENLTGISISFSDYCHSCNNPVEIEFDSITEVRKFAYELLEETMNFIINKGKDNNERNIKNCK